MASSKVIVIIWGTSFDGKSPGIVVPSSEQKQSGKTQTAGSHGGARFGSVSASDYKIISERMILKLYILKRLWFLLFILKRQENC